MKEEDKKKIRLKTANEDDKQRVIQYHHAAYKEMVLRQFGKWDIQQQNKFVEDDWNEGNIEIIVMDGTDCGYVKTHSGGEALHVIDIAIMPDFQRQGIGTNVIGILKERAKTMNTKLRMDAFLTNIEAQMFYERNGFKIIGTTDTHNLNEWCD